MIRIFALIVILTAICSISNGQTQQEKEIIEQQTVIALKKWFENPSISTTLDPTITKQLQDSGNIENGLKEGLWIHYSLDTSLSNLNTQLIVGDKKLPFNFSATLQKETGNYTKGKKNGVWIRYESAEVTPTYYWNRKAVTNYQAGLKEGEEISYQGYGIKYQKPLIIKHWKKGIENGIGKIYNSNAPYNLQQRYNAVNGKFDLIESYFESGEVRAKYTDTTIKGHQYNYFKEYFENGNLKVTGFYLGEMQWGTWSDFYENGKMKSKANFTNGKLSGTYKYFHDNGQLWTERIYKEGNLLEVICNFNKQGKKNDPGTIKNGKGTVNFYDENGKLTGTDEYVNGQEKQK